MSEAKPPVHYTCPYIGIIQTQSTLIGPGECTPVPLPEQSVACPVIDDEVNPCPVIYSPPSANTAPKDPAERVIPSGCLTLGRICVWQIASKFE